MNKSIVGAVIVVVVLAVAGFVAFSGNNSDSTNQSNTTSSMSPTETALTPSAEAQQAPAEASGDAPKFETLSVAQVAEHNTEDDCWTIIDGAVYDITEYLPRHPGGDEILRACGSDGSTLFNSRKTESGETVGSGTAHSQSAKSILSGYQIGTLE